MIVVKMSTKLDMVFMVSTGFLSPPLKGELTSFPIMNMVKVLEKCRRTKKNCTLKAVFCGFGEFFRFSRQIVMTSLGPKRHLPIQIPI